MMQDPQMASMMQQMQDPATTEKMKAKMEALKEDPEMAEIMKEIETGGPSAMMKYWNDPKVLQKISGAAGTSCPACPWATWAPRRGGGGRGGGGGGGRRGDGAHAASAGDHEALKALIDEDADVDAKDGEGRTAPVPSPAGTAR